MKSADLKTLLWASIEDYCGLWELVWELNALHPHNSLQENQYMALQGTLYCLSKDLMGLFYCQEPYGRITKVKVTGSYDDFLPATRFVLWKRYSCSDIHPVVFHDTNIPLLAALPHLHIAGGLFSQYPYPLRLSILVLLVSSHHYSIGLYFHLFLVVVVVDKSEKY